MFVDMSGKFFWYFRKKIVGDLPPPIPPPPPPARQQFWGEILMSSLPVGKLYCAPPQTRLGPYAHASKEAEKTGGKSKVTKPPAVKDLQNERRNVEENEIFQL
jgi:hypothetical protein